jgi:DNA-binding GntR family transcriptional regulator
MPRARLRSENLREEIVRVVRSEIFAAERRPGMKIDQDELAASLGVSSIPVREALIALEREGLVEWQPRLGAFVAEMSEEDVRDHFEITGLIKGLTTRRTVTRASDEEIDQITRAADTWMMSSSEAESAQNFDQIRSIARRYISKRLVLELEQREALFPMWLFVSTPARARETKRRQKKLMSAIRARDVDVAVETITETYRGYAEQIVEELRQRGFWDRESPDQA